MTTHPIDDRPTSQFYGRKFLRFNELREIGLVTSRQALARLIREGQFPPGIRLGARTLVWDVNELADLVERRKAERTGAPPPQSSPTGGPA